MLYSQVVLLLSCQEAASEGSVSPRGSVLAGSLFLKSHSGVVEEQHWPPWAVGARMLLAGGLRESRPIGAWRKEAWDSILWGTLPQGILLLAMPGTLTQVLSCVQRF